MTPAIVGELRLLPYIEQWKLALERRWFHLKMQDHSLFTFSEGLSPSYSFIHCPIDVLSFPEYLKLLGVEDVPHARRKFSSDYQNVFDTAGVRANITPLRFDYDPNGYVPGVHPVAHIHIGLDNDVRLCVNRMSAVSFLLFVMRHMYPDSWSRLIGRAQGEFLTRSIRAVSTRIEPRYWGELDRIELHMNT